MRARTMVAVTFAVLAVLLAGLLKLSKSTRWQFTGDLLWKVDTTERLIALTFDDGPMPGHVDEVLEVLRSQDARATFFLTGAGIAADRADAVKIVAAGHEVGNHTYSHRRMLLRSEDFIREEIEKTDALIRGLGVEGEILFRPPYGKKLIGLPRFLARTHRRTITWTIEAEADPSRGRDPASIARHVVGNVRPGAIVLFHVLMPSREAERRALPVVLTQLAREGYRVVSVSQLLAHSPGKPPPPLNTEGAR